MCCLLSAIRCFGFISCTAWSRKRYSPVQSPSHAEHGKQRGLPRPGWAHDGDELPRGDLERDLPQDEEAAVALGDGLVEVLELDHSYLRATIGSTCAARRAGR